MWKLEISNIGGIHEATPVIEPGINAVQASNWQGKTSLVTAIRTILGGSVDATTLTDGVDSGTVRLQIGDEEYERHLKRSGRTITTEGTPYLQETPEQTAAELFAFLGEQNPIRTAVREREDLTPHLIEPLEQENIEGQIKQLKSERENVKSELDRSKEAVDKLPVKETNIERLQSKLKEQTQKLEEVEGNDTTDGDQEAFREELTKARREREQTTQRVNRLKNKIDSLESQIDEKKQELDRLTVPSEPELAAKLDTKQTALRELNQEIETLNSLYNAMQNVLNGDHLDLLADVDRQLDADHMSCWVCGTETTVEAVEARIEELSDLIAEHQQRQSELEETVSDLQERQQTIDQQRRQKQTLEDSISTLESNLADSREDLANSKQNLTEQTERVETLENKVQETDDQRKSLEQEIARTETKLERLQDEKATLEEQAQQRDQLQEKIDRITEEIETLRSRHERIVQSARESFDEALEDIIEEFDPSFEQARLEKHVDPNSGRTEQLELIIARDGREITVDTLSEGEVELIGIITALAGYEAFDVADEVPCILLDDLGGLASEHLHTLVEYLSSRTEYLVTTAYPEAGQFSGHILSPSEWDVVSDHASQIA